MVEEKDKVTMESTCDLDDRVKKTKMLILSFIFETRKF